MTNDAINNCTSYTTQGKLLLSLKKLGFENDRFLIVCTWNGRFTAIFPVSNIEDGNMTRYARHGYMTLG